MTIVFAIKAWFEKSVTFPKLGNIFLYLSRISLSVVNDIGAFKRQQEVNGKLFTGLGRFFEKSQLLIPLFGNRYFSSIFVYSDDHPRRGFDTAAKKNNKKYVLGFYLHCPLNSMWRVAISIVREI